MRTWLTGQLLLVPAGCALPAHDLSVETIRELPLERVDVVVPPTGHIHWPALKDDVTSGHYAQADAAATAVPTDPFGAAIAGRLNEKAHTAIEPVLKPALAGTKPVVTRITILDLNIPSMAEGFVTSMFVGAGSFQSKLDVSVEIVDARSGAPIVALSKVDAATEGTQTPINLGPGVFSGDPIERMFAQLAGHLRDWLLKA